MEKKKGRNEIEKAKETVFRFLSYRPRSIEEVRRKLKEKDFPPHTIKRVLARVEELGYLNDRDYAYTFACSSIENKQWGTLRIRDALLNKGVSQEIINQTIARIEEEYDVTQVARRALEIKFAHIRYHEKADEKGGLYLFTLNENWVLDGTDRKHKARYLNHSCRPNCEAVIEDDKRIMIYAIKKISAGDELTFDYGEEYFEDLIKNKGCRCKKCQKK